MLFTRLSSRLAACGFALTMTFFFLSVTPAQQTSIFSSRISNDASDDILIARDGGRGGGRGGGGGGRGGGARAGGGSRMSRPSGGGGLSGMRSQGMSRSSSNKLSMGRSSGNSRQGSSNFGQQIQQPRTGNRSGVRAQQSRPSQPIAGQAQRPNIGQQPTNRQLNAPSQLPNQRPLQQGNLPNQPNRPGNVNQINAPKSVNVEGYNGNSGYYGENYPWGLGAAAGLTGFALGSVVRSLPANSQPVVVQGQPYYESNGMYFSPSGEGQYKVVPPPTGALEPQLPSGAKPVKVGEQTLYEVQGVYYQPTIQNGQKGYMVVTP